MYKLISDPLNGGKWQWRKWFPELGIWGDAGAAQRTHPEAIQYGKQQGYLTPTVKRKRAE